MVIRVATVSISPVSCALCAMAVVMTVEAGVGIAAA